MKSFFGVIINNSIVFNPFFNMHSFVKKQVSELRVFGTTVVGITFIYINKLVSISLKFSAFAANY